MYFEAVHSKYALGREYWLVVHRENIATSLATSPTMLRRVQLDDNVDILVDLHTPGINVTMATVKAITVTVQNLSFKLDCTRGVKLVEDPAMRSQLQVDIKKLKEHEFAVQVTVGTDENDAPAVREVMDLICKGVDAIEKRYPEDERESLDSHEELKMLALFPTLFDRYSVTCKTKTQQEAVDT
ncbi:hypothetical protein HYALB_00013931 [Hymenoscyphus albidus]|uniref:Uncharacterized protein n=1 Tax=Hymenoscyphus albidus TaxID=595503 RepID=A0A9N9M1U6_9HELO|nr:hypothetical protein HYALB_00013931 [Hymenoscyphus albidus]